MPPPTNQTQLTAANQAASGQLRTSVLAALISVWLGLRSWRDTDMDRFIRLVTPVLVAGQRRMAALTAAYLSRQIAWTTGVPQPIGTPRLGDLRGVSLTEEYGRPFHDVWRALSQGQPLDRAVQTGQKHLTDLASTDLQLAKTHTAQQILSTSEHVVGYRRVLEGAYSCGLCVVASTQRYHKADLLPIHPACDCSVAPIIGDYDPGRVIDAPLLAAAHQEIETRFGAADAGARKTGSVPDYHDVLITHQHGELGPVLAVRGQHFTGPFDLH